MNDMVSIYSLGARPEWSRFEYDESAISVRIRDMLSGNPGEALICWQPFDLLELESEIDFLSVPILFDITGLDSAGCTDLLSALPSLTGLDYFLDVSKEPQSSEKLRSRIPEISYIRSEQDFVNLQSIHQKAKPPQLSRAAIKEISARVEETVTTDLHAEFLPSLHSLSPTIATGPYAHLFAASWMTLTIQFLSTKQEHGSLSRYFRASDGRNYPWDDRSFFFRSSPLVFNFSGTTAAVAKPDLREERASQLVAPGGLIINILINDEKESIWNDFHLSDSRTTHSHVRTIANIAGYRVDLMYSIIN